MLIPPPVAASLFVVVLLRCMLIGKGGSMTGRMHVWLIVIGTFILWQATGPVFCTEPAVAQHAGTSQQGDNMQPGFIHTVLFWLKPGTTDAAKQQVIDDCRRLLGSIATVRFLAVGEPAGTERDVVDNSYQIGLVVHFADKADHDVYQKAEKHLEFIRRNEAVWERVQVYDMIPE